MRLLKHDDLESLRGSSKVTLTDGVELTVYPLPITFDMEFSKVMPNPPPDDERAEADHNLIRAAAMIVACVDSGEVQFASRGKDADGVAYYRAILDELSEFMTPAQMMKLGAEITRISRIQEEEVADAEGDFTNQGAE